MQAQKASASLAWQSEAKLLDGTRLGGIRRLLNKETRPTKNDANTR